MNRPARLAPEFPTDDVVVSALPHVPPSTGLSRLLPFVGIGIMVGVGALAWGSGLASSGPSAAVLPVVMLMSAIGMAVSAGARRSGGGLDRQRRRYLAELSRLSEQLGDAARRQHASLWWIHPEPTALWRLVGGPRMGERGRADSDFCHVRVGVGEQRLGRRIVVPPVGPVDELDPVTADALRRFVRSHVTLGDVPMAVALGGVGVLRVEGEAAGSRALVRAMVCQLAVLHSPDSVAIAAVVGAGRRHQWDWLKWLPHNACPERGGPMVYESPAHVTRREARHRRLVVIVDGVDHQSLAGSAATVIVVGDASRAAADALCLHVDGERLSVRSGERIEDFATVDGMTMAQARMCARRLARYRDRQSLPGDGAESEIARPPQSSRERLRVVLGISLDGELVELDIKEAAEGGHGPHGMCVGVTGSGKSELLRTIVAGMIARHSPDDLNLVLIDFKGGATFLGLQGLHHVAAIITNLADEEHLVTRAREALGGEIHRRQQLLRRARNAVNLVAYRRYRDVDPTLPGLPTLFVVVDEFAELLAHQPDFAELFTMIGRVGRSLGVHLLLASQRLDEGRLRGLESHLSYRICLKTSTAAESRAVLGVGDAAELPTVPGAALLRTGDGQLLPFQAAYLGGPARARATPVALKPAARLFTSQPAAPPPAQDRTAMEALVERFRGRGNPAHQVWLPPLTTPVTLAELSEVPRGQLQAPIGLIDLPFEQRQAPLVVDLGGAGGNAAVVGAPRSGKSTAVCAMITVLAGNHDSRRIQFYCLDFGGGSLEGLRSLPHVGSVASRHETELVRRTVGHVGAIVSARESRASTDQYGEVFLVVDGWSTVREEFPDLEAAITGHAIRGLSFGIHVILTAGRWADIRPALKDQIGTRVELRLGDPIDSDVDRKQAAIVPIDRPGRGITRGGHHFLLAAPDGSPLGRDESWQAPPVPLLPARVDHPAVVARAAGDAQRIVLGLDQERLEPVVLDLDREAHLLILGDRDCGKTAALRTLCAEIVRGATTRPAALFIVDFRRGLLGNVEPRHLFAYAFSGNGLTEHLPELIARLQSRLPTPDTPVEQLKNRSWWTGPDIFVVVDDYDLVSATSPDALNPLLALLPHAADIGLHVILARRCAGSARAMFEPLLAQLRDSGCAGLLMRGSPEEGPLIGPHRATTQPPGRGLLVTSSAAHVIQIGWTST